MRNNFTTQQQRQVQDKEQNGNVKTYIRFRPNNQAELDLNKNGLGQNIIEFIGVQTVKLINDTITYTVDKVFQQDCTQEQIYEEIAVGVVNDVLIGYNGTIFAYGVSGSGKSHTMFGNLDNQQQQGIIPRMCDQLFDHVNNEENSDIEYTIKCSMLEIYKENLHDSLNMQQDEKIELKIKEHPQKGIIVQGLIQRQVGDENELIDLIDFGYSNRQTRATKLNEYSSRSHTIFMVQITQKLASGAEKNGKLNLIDLAGCEKVSKSGAVGEGLEEAIKINVSLTCLGKVIHALTTGQDHIPYRDSKLTRILQESLGGNYKTSLIVTCSLNSKFTDDTISSLKFATRAKTIKNNFKVNFSHSADSLKQTIELLKQEMLQYKSMYNNFRQAIVHAREELDQVPPYANCNQVIEMKRDFDTLLELQGNQYGFSNNLTQNQLNPAGIYNNNQINTYQLGDFNMQEMFNFGYSSDLYQAKFKSKDEQINNQKQNIQELEDKNKQLKIEILSLKKNNINIQNQLNEIMSEKNMIQVQYSKEISKNSFNKFQLEILQKQIQKLIEQICKLEKQNTEFLNEKKQIYEKKIDDLLKNKLTFAEIKLGDYFKNNFNFNFQINEDPNLIQKIKKMSLDAIDDNILAEISQTSSSDSDSSSDSQTNPNDISTSHIMNQNLLRTISALEWKQIIDYGKTQLKNNVIRIQTKHIKCLEKVIDECTQNSKDLRIKIEDVVLDMDILQNQQKNQSALSKSKVRINVPLISQRIVEHTEQGGLSKFGQRKSIMISNKFKYGAKEDCLDENLIEQFKQ
ncbi:kinesin motor domain protein, partial [Ichthyophthirius multifiliis]